MSSKALEASAQLSNAGAAAEVSQSWTVIEASPGWRVPRFGELWRFRELIYFLAWRDVKVRYKQTLFGVLWAILRPLLTMVIFTVVFGHFAHIPSEGAPYPLFSYSGLLPWTFFAAAAAQSATSLVGNAQLISKVYFPRLAIPLGAILASLLDLAVAFVVLLAMMAYYRAGFTPALLVLPLFVVLAVAAALAVGIWLSALSVQYRDVAHLIPFLIQLWLYATPVAYPASLIHGKLHVVFALNPMAGVVEGFRWAVLGNHELDGMTMAVSSGVTLFFLVTGLVYFGRMERRFADVV